MHAVASPAPLGARNASPAGAPRSPTLDKELFVVPDAFQDERFADNPLTTGHPNVCFYAGAPLITLSGEALGTLCVIDEVPRELDDRQREALVALVRQVMAQIELRQTSRELIEESRRRESSEASAAKFFSLSLDLLCIAGLDGTFGSLNPAWETVLGYPLAELTGATFMALVHSADFTIISMAVDGTIRSVNACAERTLGHSAAELVHRCDPGLLHEPAKVVARAAELTEELGRPIEPGFEVFVANVRGGQPEARERVARPSKGQGRSSSSGSLVHRRDTSRILSECGQAEAWRQFEKCPGLAI